MMRCPIALMLLLSFAAATAQAQECVSCRSARCGGMFWIEPCKSKKLKPPKPVDKPPAGACKPGETLKLDVDFPPKVKEGDLLGIRIRTNCQAWLVVYYLEDNGPGAVLWPSTGEPAPSADAAHPASLLSAREAAAGQSLQAQLRQPGVAAHETFIVFAFAERSDFDRLKPPAGETSQNGTAYEAALWQKLTALPPARWARFAARYTIEPRR
jgi:hypothetical protein